MKDKLKIIIETKIKGNEIIHFKEACEKLKIKFRITSGKCLSDCLTDLERHRSKYWNKNVEYPYSIKIKIEIDDILILFRLGKAFQYNVTREFPYRELI